MEIDVITAFYVNLGLIVVSLGLGYYLGERGWTGVQNDLNNVKVDIAHLQGKLNVTPVNQSIPQTVKVTTPVASSPITNPVTVTTTPSI